MGVILDWLASHGIGAGAGDWWNKYQWIFWLILILIVIIVIVWAYSVLGRR